MAHLPDQVNIANQQRIQLGLPRLEQDDPEFQRAAAFNESITQTEPLLQQAETEATQRADTTFGQLRQAGLLSLADQFRRSQRSIAFDTARRGTLGGSRSIERTTQAQEAANRGVGGVLQGARAASEQQRLQELGPIFGVQSQLAGGDQFQNLLAQNQLGAFQQQGNAATGQFDIRQSQNAITSASGLNQAQNISGFLGGLGTGLFNVGSRIQDRNQLNTLRGF